MSDFTVCPCGCGAKLSLYGNQRQCPESFYKKKEEAINKALEDWQTVDVPTEVGYKRLYPDGTSEVFPQRDSNYNHFNFQK